MSLREMQLMMARGTPLTTSPTASVSDTTARVSFRTVGAATVAVKYGTASDLSGATTTAGVAVDSTTDFTGKLDIAGLTAGTAYYYTLLVNGADKLSAPYPTFKTFPATGTPAAFSFAFGSCTKHTDTIGADTIFDAVPASAGFLLHLGDTIYADRDAPTTTVLSGYRQKHQDALAAIDSTSASYKALRKRMPVFTMLDDHDIVNDADGSTSSTTVAQAKQAFAEYAARANPDSATAGELYYAFQFGDVGFFVPDLRTHRSANSATDDSSKTILGATQKTALKDWLLTNKDTLKLKFICASVPAHGYAANTGGDSWGGVDDGTQAPNGANGFRTERNELWDYIDANQIPGVVFLSGDQHWAGSFKTTYANRPRYEFMATPYNMTNTPSFMLTAVARTADPVNGPVFWKLDNTLNFGVVTVDTTVSPATVSFQLYGTGGSLGATYLTSITTDDIDASLVPAPAITLDATFPASPHVGDAVNFDVTATLANGAIGTLTITVDQLPDGLTLGGTSEVDATHYKATVSGTLTTAEDITSTFDATGGSVAVTPLVHDFVVAATQTSSPVLVQQKATHYQGSASSTIALDQTATAGNTLLAIAVVRTSVALNTPAGWTFVKKVAVTGSSVGNIAYYTRVSDGTETGLTYTWGSTSTSNTFAVQEWEGAINLGTVTTQSISGISASQAFGPSDAPPDASAVPVLFLDLVSQSTGGDVSVPAPWNTVNGYTSGAPYAIAVVGTQPAPNAAVSGTVNSVPAGGSGMYFSNMWITKA